MQGNFSPDVGKGCDVVNVFRIQYGFSVTYADTIDRLHNLLDSVFGGDHESVDLSRADNHLAGAGWSFYVSVVALPYEQYDAMLNAGWIDMTKRKDPA